MTELRQQLLSARATYSAAHYPGDLAETLLGPARPARLQWNLIARAAGILTGVAAGLTMFLAPDAAMQSQINPDQSVAIGADLRLPPIPDTPHVPAMPESAGWVPELQGELVLYGLPSFSSPQVIESLD
jgi:hypothetical protein